MFNGSLLENTKLVLGVIISIGVVHAGAERYMGSKIQEHIKSFLEARAQKKQARNKETHAHMIETLETKLCTVGNDVLEIVYDRTKTSAGDRKYLNSFCKEYKGVGIHD